MASFGSSVFSSTARATGSSIRLVAVFDIHMDKAAAAAMKPNTSERLELPPKARTMVSAIRLWAPLFSSAVARMKPPRRSSIRLWPYDWATCTGVNTPSSGNRPRGRNEVAGMGMGSNTHQTTQITVMPRVKATSLEKPLAYMRYAAAKASTGPAYKAIVLVGAWEAGASLFRSLVMGYGRCLR